MKQKLTVCWISAGVSSFVAGWLKRDSIDEWIYIDIDDQHEDSIRFIKDCEKVLGKKIQIVKSKEYRCVEDCLLTADMIKLSSGFAPCTSWLKIRVRKEWEEAHKEYDLTYVWGYDFSESNRAARMVEHNPQASHLFPLIDKYLRKEDVHGYFDNNFSFARPKMYDMGYPNNNCIGCIKGAMGYWNKIRVDFPEVFARRAEMERVLGHSILKESDGTPLYLDELDPDRGNMNTEVFPACSIMCYIADQK